MSSMSSNSSNAPPSGAAGAAAGRLPLVTCVTARAKTPLMPPPAGGAAGVPMRPRRDAAGRAVQEAQQAKQEAKQRTLARTLESGGPGGARYDTRTHLRTLPSPRRRMAARFRPRCARELEQRVCRRCATAAAPEAPPLPPPALDAQAAKRPPRTEIDAEIVCHARTLRVDPHSFSGTCAARRFRLRPPLTPPSRRAQC